MNKIFLINAYQIYPVGDAGGVIVSKDIKSARKMAKGMGFENGISSIRAVGQTKLKEQILFYNTTNY